MSISLPSVPSNPATACSSLHLALHDITVVADLCTIGDLLIPDQFHLMVYHLHLDNVRVTGFLAKLGHTMLLAYIIGWTF
jgi:hypothetical protein